MNTIADQKAKPAQTCAPAGAGRGALASLALCALLSSLGMSSANVALPALAQAFGASFQQVQWVVIAYLLATTTLVVSAGRLGDIVGRRRLLLGGIALFTAASAVSGAAPTLWVLIAARAGQGLGAAVMMALAMAMVSAAAPKTKAGSAMGMLGAMSAVGTALGPSLGGLLIDAVGWRAIFGFNLPLGVLTLACAHRWLPRDLPHPGQIRGGFDYIGTLLLAATLGAYALSMTLGRSLGPLNLALLLGAAIGLVLFVFTQSRAASPMLRLSLLRNAGLRAGIAASALVSTVMMATLVVGPFYLSVAFGLNAAMVGLVMSAGPVCAALAGVPAGRLADRFGPRRMALAGLAGIAAGSLALSRMPTAFGVSAYLGAIAVMTVSYALFQTANNTAVMASVPSGEGGVIAGVLNLSRNVGFITGAGAMGLVFAMGAGSSKLLAAPAHAVADGMRLTFGVGAGLIAIALLVSAASRPATRGAPVMNK